jgi:mxaJ protein
MSSNSPNRIWVRSAVAMVAVALAAAAAPPAEPECCPPAETVSTTRPAQRQLRLDADANNLPFTNDKLAGFENRIAAIIGSHLHASPTYIWRAQRRGFFKHALKEGECDVVLAVPAGFDMGLTTKPYYRSSYAFVYRKSAALEGLRSLDDPRLRTLRIGIQLVGDDGANPPPAHALGARGLGNNLVGYNILGDYREENPPARVMRALASGEVDVAVAWGPVAGYFAGKLDGEFVVAPIAEEVDPKTKLPMTFDICMAVRRGDTKLRDELNAAIDVHREEIGKVLREFGIPLLPVRELPPGERKGD